MKHLVVTTLAVLAGCGGAASETRGAQTPPAGAAQANQVAVVRSEAVPTLTEAMVQADASGPGLIVDSNSAWVIIPSFRLGFQMPEGWFWMSAEEMRAGIERTQGSAMAETDWRDVTRAFQAAANRFRTDDPYAAGRLIPSVRLFLIEAAGDPPADLCATGLLAMVRQQYPDAQVAGSASSPQLDATNGPVRRASVRCLYDHAVAVAGRGSLPAHSEIMLIGGASHAILIASVGGREENVSANLDGVLRTARSL